MGPLVIQGLAPVKPINASGPYQPFKLPRCTNNRVWPPEWSGCQSTLRSVYINEMHSFTLTPRFPTHKNNTFTGYNYSFQNPKQGNLSSPFDAWQVCNLLGACTDISAVSMLNGGKFLNCSYKQNYSSTFETTVNVSCPNNITYQPTPIYISPPFLFLVTNASELNDTLNCTKNRCLSQCWNVMAFNIPTHVPIPVSIPEDKLPVVLSRKKRDFGITAAVVTALAISTAAAAAAAVSLLLQLYPLRKL